MNIESFDRMMKFAVAKDYTDNNHYLYRVNAAKNKIEKLSYTDNTGAVNFVSVYSKGFEIRSTADSEK